LVLQKSSDKPEDFFIPLRGKFATEARKKILYFLRKYFFAEGKTPTSKNKKARKDISPALFTQSVLNYPGNLPQRCSNLPWVPESLLQGAAVSRINLSGSRLK
jgi:hypothetical protein